MVFGKGKINIQIDKFNFVPGETIEGTVTLQMKKQVKAKSLAITLTASERKATIDARGRRTAKNITLFSFEHPLDGEKEYQPGDHPLVYPFKIKIPENVVQKFELPEGKLGTALKAARFVIGGGAQRRISWHLTARLNVPWGVDVKKVAQVNVT